MIWRRIIVLGVVVALVLSGCGGGDGQKTSDRAEKADGRPFAGDGPLRGIVMASAINENARPVKPALAFSSDAPKVTAIVPLGDDAEGETLEVAWYQKVALGQRKLLFEHRIEAAPNAHAYSVGASPGRLLAGNYEVVATLDEHKVWAAWTVVAEDGAAIDLSDPPPNAQGEAILIAQSQGEVGPPTSGDSGVEEWGDAVDDEPAESRPPSCDVSVYGGDLYDTELDVKASASGFEECGELVMGACAGECPHPHENPDNWREIARGEGSANTLFDVCGLPGGSDLPGTVIVVAAWRKGHQNEAVRRTFTLVDLGAEPIAQLDSLPKKGSKVKPGQKIDLLAVAMQLPPGPGIRFGVIRGPEGVVARKDWREPVACDPLRYYFGLKDITYVVPPDPPPKIELELAVEDHAGKRGTDTATFFTGEVWEGTIRGNFQAGPDCTPGTSTGEVTLAVAADGTVTGEGRQTSSAYMCFGSGIPASTEKYRVKGMKNDEAFELNFGSGSVRFPIEGNSASAKVDRSAGGSYTARSVITLRCTQGC